MTLETHDLIKLLIPDGETKRVATALGLGNSTVAKWRRKSGSGLTDTGSKNPLDRLKDICELRLDDNAQIVRMIGELFIRMADNHTRKFNDNVTTEDVLIHTCEVTNACAAVASKLGHFTDPSEEVARAKTLLEEALFLFEQFSEQQPKTNVRKFS